MKNKVIVFFRHEALVSLLNKLGTQYFGLKPVEFEQRRVLDPNDIRKLKIDRKWYLGQIQHRFSDRSVRTETTQLLDCLEYNEIFCFMNTNHFNKSNLKDCLKFGISSFNGDKESALLRSSIECVFKQVRTIANRIDFISKVSILKYISLTGMTLLSFASLKIFLLGLLQANSKNLAA